LDGDLNNNINFLQRWILDSGLMCWMSELFVDFVLIKRGGGSAMFCAIVP
jgi:hypothetical protein